MNALTRITLEQAQEIAATEPNGTERWAIANTIISLHTAIQALQFACDQLEEDIARWRERGRMLADAVRDAKNDDNWEPSRMAGWK